MTDSQNLLAEYARTGSETAFRELVNRYVDLVYSTALRLVGGDTHRAKDVAQTVFVDLARLAQTLSTDVMPGGWLHRHTCFVAANTIRGERRRQSRERQAVEINALQDNPGADFSLVAPILDEAINELGDADRAAILLRFFEQRDFHSVGQALGSSEDAARMRVNRALEKLESLLKRRNVTTSSAALAVVLGANAVQAAPAALAVTISTAALAGTTIASTATATVTKAVAMTALQKTLIATTIAVVAGTGIYEARQASTLRTQVQTLQQQQTPLIGEIQQLQHQRDDATNRLAILNAEALTAKTNFSELLKLRGEVGQLQRQLESEKLQASQKPTTPGEMKTHAPGTYIPYDNLANAGYATPEAALETLTWVMAKGTYDQAKENLSPEMLASETNDPKGREQFETSQNKMGHLLKGMQIVAEKTVSDDKVELKIKMDYDPAISQFNQNVPHFFIQPMVKVGDQWKLGGSTREYREDWGTNGQIQSFVP